MTTFDDREKGFEAKYKHDQERQFKLTARRNKLLGLWAAEKLGLEGDEAGSYAKDVIVSDFEKPGDDDVIEKVLGDFVNKGLDISEQDIRRELENCAGVARDQLNSEG